MVESWLSLFGFTLGGLIFFFQGLTPIRKNALRLQLTRPNAKKHFSLGNFLDIDTLENSEVMNVYYIDFWLLKLFRYRHIIPLS